MTTTHIQTEQELLEQDEHPHPTTSSNPVYGFGLIGAWVYYLRRATTTRERVMGVLKGFVWPAILVYEIFKFLDKE